MREKGRAGGGYSTLCRGESDCVISVWILVCTVSISVINMSYQQGSVRKSVAAPSVWQYIVVVAAAARTALCEHRGMTQREGLHIPVGNTLIAAWFPDSVFCSKIRHLD